MKSNNTRLEPQLALTINEGVPRVEVRCVSPKLSLDDHIVLPVNRNARRLRRTADRVGKRLLREAALWHKEAEQLLDDGDMIEVERDESSLRVYLEPLELPLKRFRSGSGRPRYWTKRRIRRAIRDAIRLRETWLSQTAKWEEPAYRLRRSLKAGGPRYEVASANGRTLATAHNLEHLLEMLTQHCKRGSDFARKPRDIAVHLEQAFWSEDREHEIEF